MKTKEHLPQLFRAMTTMGPIPEHILLQSAINSILNEICMCGVCSNERLNYKLNKLRT